MPRTINIHAAKTHLSKLVDRAASGEEIIIARSGRPVARLAPLAKAPPARQLGLLKGKVHVADDFDTPLPERILSRFSSGLLEPPRRKR